MIPPPLRPVDRGCVEDQPQRAQSFNLLRPVFDTAAVRFLALLLLAGVPFEVMAAEGKIYKVLPTFIDKGGRHSLSPSLYERDAYQGHMRKHPDLRKGLRFDVHWKAHGSSALKLHIDIRGTKDNEPTNLSAETSVKPPRLFGKWSAVVLGGDDFTRMGELRSWRATIMDGDQIIAEQKSFLW